MIGQPGQCIVRMTEDIGAGPSARLLTIDQGATFHINQIRDCRARDRSPENDAGGEEIVGYERWRAKRFPPHVAVVDDFDRRQIALDAARHRISGEGCVSRNEILFQTDRNLALDTKANEICCAKHNPSLMRSACVDATCARVWNGKVLLHDLAGTADLVPDQWAQLGCQELMNCRLNPVAFLDALRHDLLRQARQWLQAFSRCGDDLRSVPQCV